MISNINWTDLRRDLLEEIKKGLDIRIILSGKRIFDALYYKFLTYHPTFMKGKRKSNFKNDLSMYINYGKDAKTLVKNIEQVFLNHFGTKYLAKSEAS